MGSEWDVWILLKFDLCFYIAIEYVFIDLIVCFLFFFVFVSFCVFFVVVVFVFILNPSFFLFFFSFFCSIILCCEAGFDSPAILAGRPR